MIPNYHDQSMKYEDEFFQALLAIFEDLIKDLNDVTPATPRQIEFITTLWKVKSNPAINELNQDYLRKLNDLSNKVIPATTDNTGRLEKLVVANKNMINITTDYVKDKFTALVIQENTYNYGDVLIDELLNQIVNGTEKRLDDFVTMSTINNLRTLIIDTAESQEWTEYLWQTQEDNKVRPEHVKMNKRWIRFDDPTPQPAGCHVGQAYNCRCYILDFRRPAPDGGWIYYSDLKAV